MVLLHLFHYGETYGRAVSNEMGISLLTVQNQLERFELTGLLVSKSVGRTRVYTWNPKSPLVEPVKKLVQIRYESIPLTEREQIFVRRRRPRRKGKPVIRL